MRWHVDLSTIGTDSATSRYCVEAEGWQKALQVVRAQRGDDGPLGNFSIELLDDGYRAIDPQTRTRFVVSRAADDAELSGGDAALSGAAKVGTTPPSEQIPSPLESSKSNGVPAGRSSNRGRLSERGSRARPQNTPSPVIPSDPVPRPSQEVLTRSSTEEIQRPVVPLVPSRPMQAETAFERMTGGSAVPLPEEEEVTGRADIPTQVLSAFKVVSRRTEDPTPSSPLTYRELSIAVPEGTSLADAEAIASAQLMMIRNAVSGAPKGQFIQLAIFDYEYTTKPNKGPPIVTLTFKDWRNAEPELRYPKRDGVMTSGPSSLPPRVLSSEPPRAPPVALRAPSAPPKAPSTPPKTEDLATTVVQAAPSQDAPVPSVPVPSVTPSTARSGESSVLAKQMMGAEGSDAPPERPSTPGPTAPGDAQSVDVIRAISIVATEPSFTRPDPLVVEPVVATEPPAAEPIVPERVAEPPAAEPIVPERAAEPPAAEPIVPERVAEPPAAKPIVPERAAEPPAAEPIVPKAPSAPPPSPSALRREASAMAGDDELTLVKDSNPPPALSVIVDVVVPPATKTERIAVQPVTATLASGTPASAALAQAVAAIPLVPSSIAPPTGSVRAPHTQSDGTAAWGGRTAESAPPPSRAFVPGLIVRTPKPRRKAGDELIADLFEACSDLAFVQDPLDGAEFVADLVMDSVPCLIVLVSFFDINTREFVVVRQIVAKGEGESLPVAVLVRASEFGQNITRTMRSGRAVLFSEGECANLEDARFTALALKPSSLGAAPVKFGGRFLGLIELCDPLDGRALTESDGHALTYIGEQFGEFLSEREISVDPEYVRRSKLSQITRR